MRKFYTPWQIGASAQVTSDFVGVAYVLRHRVRDRGVVAPLAAADPPPSTGWHATIDDLQAQGYDVEIKWVNGFDAKPLPERG
jgi:hypothetical protein